MVLEVLPHLAGEVASPLKQTREIVLLGGSGQQGKKTRTLSNAQGAAERIRLVGAAEAGAAEARGRAEAEGMRVKAEAYKNYGDAALVSMVLEVLPHLAGEVSTSLESSPPCPAWPSASENSNAKTFTEIKPLFLCLKK